MKRELNLLVFVVAVTLFSVGVWAANCDDGQELFSISAVTNAHGEEWDGTENYETEICFNEIFSSLYGGANPRDCTGDNVILRLSDSTNAHAERLNGISLDYHDVCFGNLECFIQDSSYDCNESPGNNEYCLVASLSDVTNAHISLANVYPFSICCKSDSGGCRCDYDGICDPGQGETSENCPDCPAICGDGDITGAEQCDCGPNPWDCSGGGGDELDEETCTSYPPESTFTEGTLSCYPPGAASQCLFDSTGCSEPVFAECENGADDDGDGHIDYGEDDGCGGYSDNSEARCGDNYLDDEEECDEDDWGDVEGCEDLGGEYVGGDLSCTSSCMFDRTDCIESEGFCIDNLPFEFQDSGGAWLAPTSCQDYNRVYDEDDEVDERKQLCELDCMGVSDPTNNGYGGLPLSSWGCAWDNSGKECYFSFNSTANPDSSCRLNYTVLEDCGPDSPFRKVNITAYLFPSGGSGTCEACENGQPSCETQILCPKVVQLPFIGAFGLALVVIIIVLIYIYRKKKK